MDEKQMTKGREAYQMMDEACNQLVKSGNWQRVGSSDIKLFLDMYVQALLLKMAQTTGEISEAMLIYIASVPARDILNIGKASAQQARISVSRIAPLPRDRRCVCAAASPWMIRTARRPRSSLSMASAACSMPPPMWTET